MRQLRESITSVFDPINKYILTHSYYLLILIGVILIYHIIKKIIAAYNYKKNIKLKGKTNLWFEWEEYNEYFKRCQDVKKAKKAAELKARAEKREMSRHPKKP